jgi:hypothetical protein
MAPFTLGRQMEQFPLRHEHAWVELTQRLQHCVRVLVGSRGLQSFIHGARQGVHGRRPVTDPRGRSLDRPDADGRLSRNHGQDASNLPGRLSSPPCAASGAGRSAQ